MTVKQKKPWLFPVGKWPLAIARPPPPGIGYHRPNPGHKPGFKDVITETAFNHSCGYGVAKMNTTTLDSAISSFMGNLGYQLMLWSHEYMWPTIILCFLFLSTIGFTPLKSKIEDTIIEVLFVWIRKALLFVIGIFIVNLFVMYFLYAGASQADPNVTLRLYMEWVFGISKSNSILAILAIGTGFFIQVVFRRYLIPIYSGILRKMRFQQVDDEPSDIRKENGRYKPVDFRPEKLYSRDGVLVGVDEKKKPIRIPLSTWYETNMQVIGPTRYGKGVILGCLMDQSIKRGDCVFYIDPKRDRFAPHIMYQAAREAGRSFYYLTLHDDGIGKWAPFAGGSPRDAFSRLEMAFGLEMTGDPGTDYYKGQEIKDLQKAFAKSRHIDALNNLLATSEANRTKAELSRWAEVRSLCPSKGSGFSIEKALTEGAVVYVQGSLDDSVVKAATKTFIAELIQEARRLEPQRKTHLTAVIDEVSFLASKILAQALATAVGFRVNFVLAYQSQSDLLSLDDKSVNPKYVHHSINVNSQLKAVYGGADYETAEWAANLSGTIMKEVTRLEHTEVSDLGGEKWNKQRAVGMEKENHIHTNTVLSLPPRVCVFVQPGSLLKVCFTSFVTVKDNTRLEKYIAEKSKPTKTAAQDAKAQESIHHIDSAEAVEFIRDAFSMESSEQPEQLDKQPPVKKEPKKSAQVTAADNMNSKDGDQKSESVEADSQTDSMSAPDKIIEARRARRKRQAEKKKALLAAASGGGSLTIEASPASDTASNSISPFHQGSVTVDAFDAAQDQVESGSGEGEAIFSPSVSAENDDFEFAPVKADSELLALLNLDDSDN